MITDRQAKILSLLEAQTDFMTLIELGEKLNFSNKTIRADIQSLIPLLPEEWSVESVRGKGIRLLKPANENVEATLSIQSDMQIIMQIFKKLLSNKTYTVEKLSEVLFLNIKSTREYLKELETLLIKNHLTLKRNPLRILGDETLIRLTMYTLKKEVFGERRLYYDYYSENDLDQLVEFFEEIGIKIFPLSLSKFMLYANIAAERYQSGHVVTPCNNKFQLMNHELYTRMLPFFIYFEKMNNLTPNEDERIELFSAFTYSEFYFTEIIDHPEESYQKIMDESYKHPHLFSFLQTLEEEFSILFSKDTLFVVQLFEFIERIKIRKHNQTFVHGGSRESTLFIFKKYQEETKIIQEISDYWTESYQLSPFTPDFISVLVTLIERTIIESNQLKQRILFLYSESMDLMLLGEARLEKYFGTDSTIQTMPYHSFQPHLYECYDVILTDTPLEDAPEKTILINSFIEDPDIIAVRKIIKANQYKLRQQIWRRTHKKR